MKTFVSRRQFVRGALATGATGAAVASGLIVVGCGNDVIPAPIADVLVDDNPASAEYGTVKLDRRRYPDLTPAGGALTLRLQTLPPDAARTFTVTPAVLLAHLGTVPGAPEYAAMDSACPHAGCPLGYSQKDQLVECPCHGSRFQPVPVVGACSATVDHPPATQGPRTYPVTVQGDTLFIDLRGGAVPKAKVVDGKVTLSVADFPLLAAPGGSQVFDCGQISGYSGSLVVVRSDSSTVSALDARCTHTGCTVAYANGPKDLECACHGSRFDLGGKVLQGPAASPLPAFPTTFDGTTVVIAVK